MKAGLAEIDFDQLTPKQIEAHDRKTRKATSKGESERAAPKAGDERPRLKIEKHSPDRTVAALRGKDDGRVWPTPLCFLFGQGHQHFLDRLSAVPTGRLPKALEKTRKAADLNDPQFIAATLFGPWTRSEATDSFRWDPIEDRRYALRARDPSGDPAGTQHGANRLGAIGLSAMSGTMVLRRGGMRFLNRGTSYGTAGRIEISWPIWDEPARLTGLRALLARSELAMETPDEQKLNAIGVIGLFRAERISVGKFFNVTPATRVF
jgi:hypothetical protein